MFGFQLQLLNRFPHSDKPPKNTFKDGAFLLIPKYFCAVYDYAGKADLSKGY